eukprot:4076101-Pyramimonas_sp.AAC.1
MLELAQQGHPGHFQLAKLQEKSDTPILEHTSGNVNFQAYYQELLGFRLTVVQALQRAALVRTVATDLSSPSFSADARAS